MIKKYKYLASEVLLEHYPISKSTKKEITLFIQRNKLVKDKFCERCLKAHLIKKAKKGIIKPEEIFSLKLECEEGHQGYYLDADTLNKI
jgi:hypothetical protein